MLSTTLPVIQLTCQAVRRMIYHLLYLIALILTLQFNISIISNYGIVEAAEDASSTTTTTSHNDDDRATTTGTRTTESTDNVDDTATKDFEKFLMACSQGDVDTVKEFVQKDTKYYATAYSKNGGESCLHVAGILGQSTITQYILQHGGNPNQRSQNIPDGLRMTPLSWNVYGNHIDNVQILLKAGADVNLDFDYVIDGTLQKVTVFDLLLFLHGNIDFENNSDSTNESDKEQNSNNDEKLSYERSVRAMYNLLLQHGAKRYTDIDISKNNNNSNQKVEL